jgi:hypothetical protein
MMKTNKHVFLIASLAILAGCTKVGSNGSSSTSLPTVGTNDSSLNYYARATATFGVSASNGDASGDTSKFEMHLLKKSYASGTCTGHTSCYDFTDITVNNTESTIFSILQSGQTLGAVTQNGSLTNFATVNISALFDNNLFACGGAKCTNAIIRVYTISEPSAGLYNPITTQAIPLNISDTNLAATPIGLTTAGAVTLENDVLPASQQVESLTNLTNLNFNFSANMAAAGTGVYQTEVVFEYDLATAGNILAGPNTTYSPTPLTLLSYYNDPLDQIASGGGDAAYYSVATPTILALQNAGVISMPYTVQVASDNSMSILAGFDGSIQ